MIVTRYTLASFKKDEKSNYVCVVIKLSLGGKKRDVNKNGF